MKNKLTLTIGIPAHNEEKSIASLLNSIFTQECTSYSLRSIIVTCDGCTDNTAKIVAKLSKVNKKITLLNDGKRFGKSSRINQLFKNSKSEILLLLDADVLLANNQVLNEIVKEFSNENIVLVGGHDKPYVSSMSIQEKIIIAGVNLWHSVRKSVAKKDLVHNIHGSVYALHKKFYKKIFIPKEIINDDMYFYLKSHALGFKCSFAKKAIVYYQAPTTLKDFYKQTKRFSMGKEQLDQIFLKNEKYFVISQRKMLQGIFNYFKQSPLDTVLALLLQISISWIIPFISKQYNEKGIWSPITSTKTVISL